MCFFNSFFFFWFDKINNSNLIHLIPSILTKQIHLEVLLLESGGKDMQTKSVVYQPTKKSSNQGFELQNYQFNINFTCSKNSFCNYFAYWILSYYDIYIVWRIVVYRYIVRTKFSNALPHMQNKIIHQFLTLTKPLCNCKSCLQYTTQIEAFFYLSGIPFLF